MYKYMIDIRAVIRVSSEKGGLDKGAESLYDKAAEPRDALAVRIE